MKTLIGIFKFPWIKEWCAVDEKTDRRTDRKKSKNLKPGLWIKIWAIFRLWSFAILWQSWIKSQDYIKLYLSVLIKRRWLHMIGGKIQTQLCSELGVNKNSQHHRQIDVFTLTNEIWRRTCRLLPVKLSSKPGDACTRLAE